MILHLKRYSYGKFETEGVLNVGGEEFATIERPWILNPNGAKGGKPFDSCIPDGMYRLTSHTRPNRGEVFLIWNPELGVHRYPDDHEKDFERDLCLIHLGNWTTDINGCIAPGLKRLPMYNKETKNIEQAVSSSGAAMKVLRDLLGETNHILSITSELGANDV